jgi:hypothetical protein
MHRQRCPRALLNPYPRSRSHLPLCLLCAVRLILALPPKVTLPPSKRTTSSLSSSSLSSIYSAYWYYQMDSPSPSPTNDTLQIPASPLPPLYAPPLLRALLHCTQPRHLKVILDSPWSLINFCKRASSTTRPIVSGKLLSHLREAQKRQEGAVLSC